MNLEELAREKNVSAAKIRDWVRLGCPYLKAGRRGKAWDFSESAVEKWVKDFERRELTVTIAGVDIDLSSSFEEGEYARVKNIMAKRRARFLKKQAEEARKAKGVRK